MTFLLSHCLTEPRGASGRGKIIQGSKNLGVAVRAFEETSKYAQDCR